MAGKQLAGNVWAGGVFYAAGSTPPNEVAEQITNPKAWADEPAAEESDSATPAKKATAKRSSRK